MRTIKKILNLFFRCPCYGPELISPLDLNDGWGGAATIIDNDSFQTLGAGGSGLLKQVIIVGVNYRIILGSDTSATSFDLHQADAGGINRILIGNNGTFEFTASREYLYLRNVDAGITNISVFSVKEIL